MLGHKQLPILLVRGSSIGLKAFFLFFCARNLEIQDFGKLALVNNCISLMLCVSGINLFNYTSRMLTATGERALIATRHMYVTLISGLLSLGFTPIIAAQSGIGHELIPKLILIIFFEHMFTEIFRIQIPLNKNLEANLVHLIRVVCSTLLPCGLYVIEPQLFTLSNILDVWLISQALTIAALYHKEILGSTIPSLSELTEYVRSAAKVISIYFFVSIISRSFFTLDKIILNKTAGESEVGIYSFYYSMAFTIQTLIESSIISAHLHEMLNADNKLKVLKKMLLKVFATSAVLATTLVVLLPLVLRAINKEEIANHSALLIKFLVSATLFSVALAISMPLYAVNKDKKILFGYVAASCCFAGLSYYNNSGMQGIASNMVATYAALTITLAGLLLMDKDFRHSNFGR